MENITVLISSFLVRGQRWRLVALAALFFVAGCTVELYPPAQDVSNLPDGGKVDVLPDTIPRAFAFGPRIYWSQIVASDSAYSIAVTDANNKGRWLDSLRWVPSGPFVTVNGDTLSTRAYARDSSGVTGDNQILTYNGSGSLTIENGNTVDMSDLLDNTDDQTIDTFSLSGTTLSLSLESDGQAAQTVDLSALAVIDSTRLTQDSILVYYQDGAEVGRDTIAGVGGGGADDLGDHTMTQNLQTNGNWISGDGGNEGIGVDASGKVGIGTLTPSYILDLNSTDAVRLPVGTTAQRPTGTNGLLRYNSDLSRLEGYYNAEWNGLSSTLADISSNSTTTAKSLYSMTSGQNVEFRRSAGTPLLYLNESTGRVGVGISPTDKFTVATSAGDNIIAAYDYSDNSGHTNYWFSRRSKSNTLGTLVTTNINDYLGVFYFQGVNVSNQWAYGAKIIVQQDNAAGTFVPSKIVLQTYSSTGENSNQLHLGSNGNVGIGVSSSLTAALRIKAGTTSLAPVSLTSGSLLTTPLAGAMEWDGTNLYITQTTGPTRKTIAYVDTDDGSASDTTDGSGDITVSHTLGSASITVTATATGTTFYHVQVHTKTSTTFKIRFFDAAGAAVTATAVTADWIAKLQ